MKLEKGKVKYSTKSRLSDDVLDPANHKVRITTYIDGDVLDALKDRAANEGSKYQTLLNDLLREVVFKSSIETRLAAIEKKLKIG